MSDENQVIEGVTDAPEAVEAVEATETPKSEPSETKEREPEPAKSEEDQAERVKQAMQKRIDKLTREKYEARAEAERLKAKPVQSDPLDRSQFDTDDDFVEAEIQRRIVAKEAEKAQLAQREIELEREVKRERLLHDAELAGKFDREHFAQNVRVTEMMAEAILDSDLGADLIVHLSANPDEAKRIAELPKARQAAEIGKLEDKLTTKAVKTSGAPEPIKPISASGNSSGGYRAGMPYEDYVKWRRANR